MEYNVTFTSLPVTMEEFKASPLAALSRPEHTAALTVAALCLYPKDKDTALAMLDFLRGPRPLSVMEKQFINDRFMDGKDYIPRSYFTGASPDNDYTPTQPYTIRMADSHAPITEEGYKITVIGVENNRVESVLMEKLEPEEDDEVAEGNEEQEIKG